MPGESGRMRPANVTAVVKDKNNRARSVAAGVVSGASDVRWCFKSRTLMRVLQVGMSRKARRNLGKAVQAACACYGWCRAHLHTRKG